MRGYIRPSRSYQLTVGSAQLQVMRQPGYNRTDYDVQLIEGEWPSDEDLLRAFHAVPQCGGGKVTHHISHKHVLVWGCD